MDSKEYINLLIHRTGILKSLIQARQNTELSDRFINLIIVDMSRCLLQDICSYIQKKEPNVDKSKLSWFEKKYRGTRNKYSHLYESNKSVNPLILVDIEQVLSEIINLVNNTQSRNIINSDPKLENVIVDLFYKQQNENETDPRNKTKNN